MEDTRTRAAAADVAPLAAAAAATRAAAAALEPGAAAAWRLDDGLSGARTLAAAAGTGEPIRAAVTLAAALAGAAPLPGDRGPARRAGGARPLTREYSYLLSSYTAETCEPLPVFNTLRGAGVAGDQVRNAQPGIEYVLLVRDRGTDEWRTAVGNRAIPAAIAHHWGES